MTEGRRMSQIYIKVFILVNLLIRLHYLSVFVIFWFLMTQLTLSILVPVPCCCCRCCCRCCCCYWPYVGRQCHEPRALPLATDTSAKLLLLFVCKWKVSEGNKCPDWVSICNWLAIQYSDKVTSPKAARKNIFQTGSTRAAPGYTPPH